MLFSTEDTTGGFIGLYGLFDDIPSTPIVPTSAETENSISSVTEPSISFECLYSRDEQKEADFMERFFELDDSDPAVLKSNFEKSLSMYFKKYYQLHIAADMVSDGEVVEPALVSRCIDELIYSYRSYCDYRKRYTSEGQPIALCTIGILKKSKELVLESQRLRTSSSDLSTYELAQWYSYCCTVDDYLQKQAQA